MCVQNWKFVALPVPEIIGGTRKNLVRLWICPRSLFSKIFHGLVFGCTLWIYLPNLKSLALAVPEIIAIAVLGWGCVPPIRDVVSVSTSRSRDSFAQRLGLVSVSEKCGNVSVSSRTESQTSRSRLSLGPQGLVYKWHFLIYWKETEWYLCTQIFFHRYSISS